jgi:hypothetical protein
MGVGNDGDPPEAPSVGTLETVEGEGAAAADDGPTRITGTARRIAILTTIPNER